MKNRTFQIILQTVFCTLGIIGILASLGLFDYSYRPNWYVYFTNLSNYFCIFVMFIELIQSILKSSNDYVSAVPGLKFMGLLMILLTFMVFNVFIVFEDERDPALNFRISSIIMHIILPILYLLDYFMFYKRGCIYWYMPLISALIPIAYVIFIYIRAVILDYNSEKYLIYPYFFLDVSKMGVFNVLIWIFLLSVIFISMGYIFFFIDSLLCKKSAK